jgi:hypothetical protein
MLVQSNSECIERRFTAIHKYFLLEGAKMHDLERMSNLHDWNVAEGEPDIRGWNVTDRNDNKVGSIDDLLVDTKTGRAIYALIGYGGALGIGEKKTLVPFDRLRLDRDHKNMMFRGIADDFRDAPEYRDDVRDYDQFHNYWQGEKVGRRPVEHGEHEDVRRRRMEEARQRGHEINERMKERQEEEAKARAAKQGQIQGVEPGQMVIREGEKVEIPIVGERTVVTGKVVILPQTGEEEEEEEEK